MLAQNWLGIWLLPKYIGFEGKDLKQRMCRKAFLFLPFACMVRSQPVEAESYMQDVCPASCGPVGYWTSLAVLALLYLHSQNRLVQDIHLTSGRLKHDAAALHHMARVTVCFHSLTLRAAHRWVSQEHSLAPRHEQSWMPGPTGLSP